MKKIPLSNKYIFFLTLHSTGLLWGLILSHAWIQHQDNSPTPAVAIWSSGTLVPGNLSGEKK